MSDIQFTKLKSLIDDTFTVQSVNGYKFKLWSPEEKKMLVSDTYQSGYRKLYEVDTDKGRLDLGSGQIGSLLEAVFYNGAADLNGKTFEVKSNGKEGIDIRYYFNLKREPVPTPTMNLDDKPPTELYDEPPF